MFPTSSAHEFAISHAMHTAQWAGVRYSRETTTQRMVRNDRPETNQSALDEGAMCEVLVDGHFGYAATADLSEVGLQRAFDRALATTSATSPCVSAPAAAADSWQRGGVQPPHIDAEGGSLRVRLTQHHWG